jgi:hypothetical protein
MTIAWAIIAVAVLYLLDKHHLMRKALIGAGIIVSVVVVGYVGFLGYQKLEQRWDDYQFAKRNECYSPFTGKVHQTNSSGPWCGADEQVQLRGTPHDAAHGNDATGLPPGFVPYIPPAPSEQQFALKDDTLGESYQTFVAHHKDGSCSDEQGLANCSGSIAGVPTISLVYEFHSGHLVVIKGSYLVDNFEQVRGAIVTKYGLPTSSGKGRTAMGKESGYEQCTTEKWERAGIQSTITLDEGNCAIGPGMFSSARHWVTFSFNDDAVQPPPEGPEQEKANKDF